jgi:hypothetical protein
MKRTFFLTLLFAELLFVSGCGSEFKTGMDWRPDEARFFDDGVDMIADISKLSGKWAYTQEDDLTGRVQLADLVAEIEIVSIQTISDVEQVETKRIKVQILEQIYGVAPDDSFALSSRSDAPGNVLIKRYEKHLTGRFLLFVRWFEGQGGVVEHHFHMSPDSEEIKAAVREQVQKRKLELKTRQIGN